MIIEPDHLMSISGLQNLGFEGFQTVAQSNVTTPLQKTIGKIATEPAIYLTLRSDASPPGFLVTGTGHTSRERIRMFRSPG